LAIQCNESKAKDNQAQQELGTLQKIVVFEGISLIFSLVNNKAENIS